MSATLRAAIAASLEAILAQGQRLDQAVSQAGATLGASSDIAFLQESVYGVMRRYYSLDALIVRFLRKPLRKKDLPIRMLLLSGLHELRYMATPSYASVDLHVAACDELKRPWAKGLVNAALRNAQRFFAKPSNAPAATEETSYEHPTWFIERLRGDWPDEWSNILSANNQHPPLVLRVNRLRQSRDDYLRQLQACGLAGVPTSFSPDGIVLAAPCRVEALPGFAQGTVSLQDEAAQLAALLLDCAPSDTVLDACAAPGGKTAHLLECHPTLRLLATDNKAPRLAELRATLQRLQLDCEIAHADARELVSPARFQRILLDAPCSASGVVRRHPDIKFHRSPAAVALAAQRQMEILAALWPKLAAGGRLLYVTCSVFRQENDEVIAEFLASAPPGVRVRALDVAWGHPTRFGRQVLPGQHDMDGFYFALLENTGSQDT